MLLIASIVAHVWDRYDYGRDKNWYASVGYPLMKGVASFWIDLLVQDDYFKDGTLVANPCNSPEHGPTVQSPNSLLMLGVKLTGDADFWMCSVPAGDLGTV
jgi:hypothetical protein